MDDTRATLCPDPACRGELDEVWVWGDAHCSKCKRVFVHADENWRTQAAMDQAWANREFPQDFYEEKHE